MEPTDESPSRKALYDGSYSGAQDRPWIPHLRSDPTFYHTLPQNLKEFRMLEGKEERERRLRDVWRRLPRIHHAILDHELHHTPGALRADGDSLTIEGAKEMQRGYEKELLGQVHGKMGAVRHSISWTDFKSYAEAKEVELWHIFHSELDLDGNGHLDSYELHLALERAGIRLSPSTVAEFMSTMSSQPHSAAINFADFRDFLLLLPRKVCAKEIFRFYEVKRTLDHDHRGASKVNMEGDVVLSAEDHGPHPLSLATFGAGSSSLKSQEQTPVDYDVLMVDDDDEYDDEEEHEENHHWLGGTNAVKFLAAGGVAGAVSRTCTAPFDRLKIFLITRPPDLGGAALGSVNTKESMNGAKAIAYAVSRIFAEGGVRGFWVGNGLSVAKIFPESAIKFLSYETSKRMFATYHDHVEDTRNISGVSRFLSGGIAGMISQLTIYPIETLKTQMMSSTGEQKKTLLQAAQILYRLGGVKAYYRGLGIGIVGVFPYAAIDMSTFEALKLAYLKSSGKQDPGVLAMLAFGSVSGSVGATTVYPLNLVRTRLQASGSSGHPQKYTGIADVAIQTYQRDGWRGFYRGLFPTLAKVVPAVSISYVVYESSKQKLGVS